MARGNADLGFAPRWFYRAGAHPSLRFSTSAFQPADHHPNDLSPSGRDAGSTVGHSLSLDPDKVRQFSHLSGNADSRFYTMVLTG
jgi:hypothetical protein